MIIYLVYTSDGGEVVEVALFMCIAIHQLLIRKYS